MSGRRPVGGEHYPRDEAEFRAWFPDDAACVDYLDWLRWGDGFECPHCGEVVAWQTSDGRWVCGGCDRRVSATSGTIFHRTRTPLSLWFQATWMMTTREDGISALGLQRVLDLGSYETAWTMLHRLRVAMGTSGRDLLHGNVEVGETLVGGHTPGRRGRTPGPKISVAVAVEIPLPKGFGRCRLRVIPNVETSARRSFLFECVEPGSVIFADGPKSYPNAVVPGWGHQPVSIGTSDRRAPEVLPGVHRVASLLKRWLESTHQGSVEPEHLPAYLDEFMFRFNRAHGTSRGLLFYRLLELAVATGPVRYVDLVKAPGLGNRSAPTPPATKRVAAPTLARAAALPWRHSRPPLAA